jgi:serine/threonine protein kinase
VAEDKFPEGYSLGHYEIKQLLGSGAFADVYLARHKLLDKEVALKVIRSSEAEAWEQQGAKIMCRLHHPHIVNVHFADRIDGRLVIAMDYVGGRTLREILQERRLEPAEGIEIATSLAEALDYVHSQELGGTARPAHLDLKPSNILIDAQGMIKITDFGMAQMLHVETEQACGTGGSPAYMAPEQFAGKPSQQSDLWAVGVLLHQMLFGRTPFRAQSLAEYRTAVCERDAEFGVDLVALPDAVQQIIRKCLERDPARRFATAKELALALAAVTSGVPLKKCPDCGADLLPDNEVCPECTLADKKKKSQAPHWQAERRTMRGSPQFLALIAGCVLLATAALVYLGYCWWHDWRPKRIAQQAVTESARPGTTVGDKEAIIREALGRLHKDSERTALDARLQRLKLANAQWQKILALEKSTAGDYDERIQALEKFSAAYADMMEAQHARKKLVTWEEESRAFQEAQALENRSDARVCAILAHWQRFHAQQKTGLRQAYAWNRIQDMRQQIENYSGYAELTVKSATGLPPGGGVLSLKSQPDAYFVVLQNGKTLYRSRTMSDNPSPIWDEKIRIMIRPGEEMVFEIREEALVGHNLLLHQKLTPFPLDGPFRLTGDSIEAHLDIRREK